MKTICTTTIAVAFCVAASATDITTDTTVPLTADSAEDYVVAVSGTGTLKILAASGVTARPAFGKNADMRLSDDGVISLPNGAAVWVKHLYVNGVQQPKGAYRYDTIQDAAVRAHFDPESTGTLLVSGDGGFSFTIR